ncbi:hypothetical protein Hypma_003597 [Hypsizygus marmoreus]|uniref:VPS9 domain-containing protein n=1 Tax=Hypsizygus marmoreus TaxID=39966 RepID=A0A369J6B0_HYPMA|nr:hypothetical protein Hypma_003597 [Hypsizygus marmoreus]
MSSKRDHLFPATSIGRTQGGRLQRVPSNESLTAHPLLSSNHSSSSPTTDTTSTSPRYVPYTPRQRVSPTSATTGTTVHPPSPQHQQGDATSKLQLVHLKAAAQNVGLDTGSVGWAMLEKLVSESDHHDAEWTEVWTTVTTGKATLLLPSEQASSNDKLTPGFVKDHIVLCDGPSRKNAPIVTLSGLRGVLNNKTLTFRSSIHPSSKVFQDLLAPSSRPTALATLPNLPTLPTTSSTYPTFSIPSQAASLPLPPRTPSPNPVKPPLPPRPGARAVSAPSTSSTSTSRLANPFASLFGGGSSNSLTFPKVPVAPAAPAPGSPTPSIRSLDSHTQSEPVVDVSAFTIDRRIVRKDVAKDMNKALKKEVKDALGEAALPAWVVDRVHEFTAEWYPFVRDKTPGGGRGGEKAGKEGSAFGVAWVGDSPEDTATRMQDFYLGLEQDLRVWVSSFLGRGKREREVDGEGEKNAGGSVEDERRVRDKIDNEAKIKEVMDAVERAICSLFYDRLYMQPTSDDSSHDEALSSRVAALNMLDLGLEHLDIHVESAGPELDLVVQACGEMLSQLETCRSPGDKAAVLVAAHKIVVDGLARLPPIRLMSEEESKAQKSKSSTLSRAKVEAPPRDVDGTLRILMPLTSEPTTTDDDVSELEMPELPESELMTPHAPVPVPNPQASPIPTIIEPHPEASADTIESLPGSRSPSPATSARSHSPVLTMSPAPEATPVSGDVLLPMIIFAVVKANPPHLVSNLLYTQRYRNQSVGGEESYCLINLMAVAEFLENVDLAALGLGDSDKVLSAADLTPIPLNRSPIIDEMPLAPIDAGSLRGRVEQANKVITGVVDSSFGILRSLLPTTAPVAPTTPPIDGVQSAAPWNAVKPGFGLLRRESGFSIKSITAALPINRGPRPGAGEESGQQLVTVSRPGSVKSLRSAKMEEDGSGSEDEETEESGDDENDEDGEGDDDEEEEGAALDDANGYGDARSIRSFENMLSAKGKKKKRMEAGARKSLTDRLAHMSSLAALRGSPPASRRASLLPPASQLHSDTPASSRPQSPAPLHLAPPIQRFIDCPAGDLRLSEVGELLRDYRRLVEGIRAIGGFDE